MPAKVKVRILAGRNLPVMDKSSDASDAFVEVKLGNTTYKTEVYRRSLNPFWNSEWFRFEVSDQELQDEPLQIRIMDYDTYSANDAIGKVYINLNPLLINPSRSMSGWLPIYDTLHGIRGEINCMVKVNLFADNNRYRRSSCGVRFFFSDIPNGYKCDAILGFVDELLVNDDPEYQWIDKIRTPRASNEARQTLFTKLSGEVQRKLGLKAEIFGGNAVIGYQQSFDLEGGSGIVGRGIGTAVVLSRSNTSSSMNKKPFNDANDHPYSYHMLNSLQLKETLDRDLHRQQERTSRHPLTHSVSADYFYEVPTTALNKKKASISGSAAPNLPNSQTVTDFSSMTTSADVAELDSELDSTISADFKEVKQSLLDNSSESTNSDKDFSYDKDLSNHEHEPSSEFQLLEVIKRAKFPNLNLIKGLKHSQSFESHRDLHHNNPRGAHSSTTKTKVPEALRTLLKYDSNSIAGKIASISQLNPLKLTKLIGIAAPTSKRNTSSSIESSSATSKPKNYKRSSVESANSGSKLDTDDFAITNQQHQTIRHQSTSASTASTSSSSAQDQNQSQKSRKRNKSQSVSLEDTLSIIEEKLDDEQHSPEEPSSANNQRGRVSSDSQVRQQHHQDATKQQTIESSHLGLVTDETSGASNETLTAKSLTPLKRSGSLSLKDPQATSGSIRGRASPDPRPSKVSIPGIVQSVKVIRAQQHLLQNIIKHQNEHLVVGDQLNQIKLSLIYPNHHSEYPFVTFKRFPENMIQCTGGVVSVHSVKLLDHIINDEESETRDVWWTELRKEIKSHTKALQCNSILGYWETSKVLGDVCILSACGTAAVMKSPGQSSASPTQRELMTQQQLAPPPSPVDTMMAGEAAGLRAAQGLLHTPMNNNSTLTTTSESITDAEGEQTNQHNSNSLRLNKISLEKRRIDCSLCHSPLVGLDGARNLATCTVCRTSGVPDVLLLTIEPPPNLNIVSSSTMVQARVCRAKRDLHGEASAKEIGEALPFLEYELHRQLFSKLKFKGFNCLYNLVIDINVGENMIAGIATGTGCFVLGLPTPSAPVISAGKGIKASKLTEIQHLIASTALKNREKFGLNKIEAQLEAYQDQDRGSRIGLMDHLDHKSGNDTSGEQKADDRTIIEDHDKAKTFTPKPEGRMSTSSKDNNDSSNQSESGNSKLQNNQHHRHRRKRSEPTTSGGGTPIGDHVRLHNHHRRHSKRHSSSISHEINSPRSHQVTSHHHHHHHHHHRMNLERKDTNGDLFADENNIILEIDDNEDANIIALLIDSNVPEGYVVCNGEFVPMTIQHEQSSIQSINMFTQVMRAKLSSLSQFAHLFDWILQTLFVKLRRSLPCCLTNLSYFVDLPEANVVQVSITGCLLAFEKQDDTPMMVESNGSDKIESDSSLAAERPKAATGSSESLSSCTSHASSAGSSSSSSVSISSTTESDGASRVVAKPAKQSSQSQKQKPIGEPAKTSIVKQFSRSNLVAMLNPKSRHSATNSRLAPEIGHNQSVDSKFWSNRGPAESIKLIELTSGAGVVVGPQPETSHRSKSRLMRTVFKKQQTYPGALSPEISGHERRLLPGATAAASVQAQKNTPGAARRLLDKVKLPQSNPSTSSKQANGTETTGTTATTATNGTSSQPSTTKSPRLSSKSISTSGEPTSSQVRTKPGVARNSSSPQLAKGASEVTSRTSSSSASKEPSTMANEGARTSLSSERATPASRSKGAGSGDGSMNSSIDISSLSYVPLAKEYHYLGNLTFSFVRETSSVRENGGLNGFIHCFLMEVYAIVRAHVSALGGNAFLSLRLQQSCIFYHSNKNQAQCLISVAGDAVHVIK